MSKVPLPAVLVPNADQPEAYWYAQGYNHAAALLAKYIDHVCQEEGSTFLTRYSRYRDRFTSEEWAELLRLEAAGPPTP